MKKIISRGFITFTLLLGIGDGLLSQEEYRDGLYMVQALARTFNKAAYVQSTSSFGFDDYSCLLAGFIRKGESVKWKTTLEYGEQYMLIGGGDEDATDLDLTVTNSSGTVVVRDNKADNNPVVSFTARSRGQYTFELKLYSCSTNASYCSLAILEDGGNVVPKSNLTTILTNLYGSWRKIHNKFDISFFTERNQWCIFGAVLRDGSHSKIDNITFGDATTVLIGAADNNSEDIDICLLNSSGANLKCDTEVDNEPVVVYRTYSGNRYSLKTTNYDSNGKKALILTSALRVK